ncbi:DUF4381 domain-containing protein [uncultured Shewanella sp.]|uniref:DUF4381 domain-containing protein n=1 Tax=Shewanella atlantica TaxID=271099 RepID=UPI00263611F4|nr:DUF4381 domain-containing protein [uncultured Shewanella sp.]
MEAKTNPALASLKDIQPPEVITSWPIAYGYWILLALIIISIIGILLFVKRQRRLLAPKRIVIAELKALDPNSCDFCVQVNTLIKRAAISYLPREQIAGLEGKQWYIWMDSQVKQTAAPLHRLLDRRYTREGLSGDEALSLQSLALQWFKEALPIKQSTASALRHNREESQC